MLVAEFKNNLTVRELGGKGYSLSILIKNGFDVPKGFVIISEAFFKFLRDNNLMEKIEKLASEIDKNNFQERSEEIKSLILNGRMLEEIVSEINKSLSKLNLQYVSIRSSAVSEDSLRASFAGLHDTFLNIKVDPDLVLENIKKCWASLFNERAIIYRIFKEIPHLEGMAIVIQKMIQAEVSGTAFTANPDTGDRGVIIIECSWGLGEAIVSGFVTPDRYIIDKNSLKVISRVIGRKKIIIIPNKNGTVRKKTPTNKINVFCISNSLTERVSRYCLNIENLFNTPQDIEWCIYKNKIWMLQSRPITSLGSVNKL